MAEIKLIGPDTDLSGLRCPIGWDLVVRGIPYDVYQVDGYNHTIGGRWGENCYWACPAGETPTYENLEQFSGDAPTWGITFDRVNYHKSKWGEDSIEVRGSCWITRNGQNFIEVTGRDMGYALAKAQYMLVQLQEGCPLNLSDRNWKEEVVGRKIWYDEQPAIVESVRMDNELWIVPDGIEKFEAPASWKADGMDYSDYEDGLRVELLSPHINWFRN